MKLQVFVLVVLTFCAWSPIYCATDTPETRHHEADRYLQAVPPKALFEDMADKMATNLPAEQRQQFKQMMTKDLDIAALSKAMTDAMVKHFTTEELKALADFYGSPVGKSAMQKVRRLHGRLNADNPGRDDESAGKAESVNFLIRNTGK